MHSALPSVPAVLEDRARGQSRGAIAPRDLDYATWHAHIAGIASRITPVSDESVPRVHIIDQILVTEDTARAGQQAA
jgi:hypothetical protein